ncbi:Fibroin light chain [Papilio xuthus]|uniref:Fibroin light chain n=1 Tax=Papilio xuthus TaxID=66420 RepID=A0A0N1ICD9_PAPXU|nr:Fibroin light chain [Papilio xuthus]
MNDTINFKITSQRMWEVNNSVNAELNVKSSKYCVISLYNEEYCAAKRLYNAFNIRSNNVGAAVTAASLSPVTKVVQRAYSTLANLLRAIGNNGNVIGAAAAAKVELLRSL